MELVEAFGTSETMNNFNPQIATILCEKYVVNYITEIQETAEATRRYFSSVRPAAYLSQEGKPGIQ